MPMNVRETFLDRTKKGDLYIPVHAAEFLGKVQINLDATSLREAVHIPASRRVKPCFVQ
jgi:hypothetical protein